MMNVFLMMFPTDLVFDVKVLFNLDVDMKIPPENIFFLRVLK